MSTSIVSSLGSAASQCRCDAASSTNANTAFKQQGADFKALRKALKAGDLDAASARGDRVDLEARRLFIKQRVAEVDEDGLERHWGACREEGSRTEDWSFSAAF